MMKPTMAKGYDYGPGRTETPLDYPRSDKERNGNLTKQKMAKSESHDGEGHNSDTGE